MTEMPVPPNLKKKKNMKSTIKTHQGEVGNNKLR